MIDKQERFLVNPKKTEIHFFKLELAKNKPLYNELIGMLTNAGIKIKAVKSLNFDTSNQLESAHWTDEQINDWIKQSIQHYFSESGIKAKWMTETEKLESIKRLSTIDRIKELFTLVKFPLLHGSQILLSDYVIEFIKEYVYHKDSIKTAKQIFRIVDEMKGLDIDTRIIEVAFRKYGYYLSDNIIVGSAMEDLIGVNKWNSNSIINVKYGVFKKFVSIKKPQPKKVEKIDKIEAMGLADGTSQDSNKTNSKGKAKTYLGTF